MEQLELRKYENRKLVDNIMEVVTEQNLPETEVIFDDGLEAEERVKYKPDELGNLRDRLLKCLEEKNQVFHIRLPNGTTFSQTRDGVTVMSEDEEIINKFRPFV